MIFLILTIYLFQQDLDIKKLRIAFIVYGGMSRTDWRRIQVKDIQFEWREFEDMLLPLLRKKDIKEMSYLQQWSKKMLLECQSKLALLLPLQENELEFLNKLLDFGIICPELICDDRTLR